MKKSLRAAPEGLRFVAYVNAAIVQGDYEQAIGLFINGLEDLLLRGEAFSTDDIRYHLSDPVSTLVRFKLGECENLESSETGVISRNCNFCGKSETDVDVLIAGAGVNICSSCVETCTDVITSSRQTAENP